MDQSFMKERAVFPLVLAMSLPMVLSMLINALYNIIDSYFVARLSEDAMTALSLVFPIQNLAGAVAIGFGIGVNAAISISLGAQDRPSADRAASYGVLLAALHGILLSVVCIAVMPAFLGAFHPGQEIVGLGLRYARVVFLFAIMNSMAITYEKIFQAVGRMTVSMFSMMCGCIANIVLDPFLIFGYGPFPALGMEGAALATGIGQTLTLVLYILIYLKAPIGVTVARQRGAIRWGMVGRLYAVGIPATLNLALPSVLVTALNGILALYAQTGVLVLGIYYKLQTFIYLTANGIIQGMRPIIGYNYGAGEARRVKKIVHIVLAMCAAIMLVGTVLCLAVPGRLMGLFTQTDAVLAQGVTALRIISLGFLFSAVSVTVSGALEGIGKGVPSLVISLLRYVLFIIPIAFLLSYVFQDARGVWHAFWVAELLTAGISFLLYKKEVRVPDRPL